MINTQGKVAGTALYSPYGKLLQSQGVQANIAYAGLYHHKETGLYLATYRGYNPFTARWLNRDPIEENGGLNLYEYVGGNPINSIDPEGLTGLPQAMTVIGVATITKGMYDYRQDQKYLEGMRESINRAENVVNECLGGLCPMPYNELSSYQDAIDRTKRRYIEKTGESSFNLARSLSGKRTRNFQLPKSLPFCD